MRKPGTGTVHPCRNGYRARLVDKSGRKVSLGVFETRDEAERDLAAAIQQMRACEPIRGCSTLLEFGELWFVRREAHGIRSVRADLNRWKAHVATWECAHWPLEAIRPVHIRAWRDALLQKRVARGNKKTSRNKTLSRQTVQNALNLVRVCLDAATEDEVIPSNPAKGITIPRGVGLTTQTKWTYLNPTEQVTLLAVIGIPDRWAAQFALGSGLRQGEQWNLELADVHIDDTPHPHVTVRFGSKGKPPKNGEIRVVPLGVMAIEAMRAQLVWLEQAAQAAAEKAARKRKPVRPFNPHGLAFPTQRGYRRAQGAPRGWEDWLKASGIKGATGAPIRWHDLRHTTASMLISGYWGKALSLEEVKGVLGHKDLKSTQRYAHLSPGAVFRAMAGTGDWRPTTAAAPVIHIGPRVVSNTRQVSGTTRK